MKYKYKKFDDFWKKVPKPGICVMMTIAELESWSENCFTQSRVINLPTKAKPRFCRSNKECTLKEMICNDKSSGGCTSWKKF